MASSLRGSLLRLPKFQKGLPLLTAKLSSSSSNHLPLTTLTEEEQAIKDTATRIATEKVAPLARKMDTESKLDPGLIKELFANGLMGIEIPSKYGGTGAPGILSTALVVEAIAQQDPTVGSFVDAQNTIVILPLLKYASEEIKAEVLPRLATDSIGSFCLSESGSGSDAFAMKTRAEKKDGDHYLLNGTKSWITSSEHARYFIVFANADPSKGYKGITAFLVDRNTPGLTVGPPEDKLGIRASSTCPVIFEDVKVHESRIVGRLGEGYKIAINTLNEGRIGIGAQMVGVAAGAFEQAVRYTLERKQFGQAIFEFQGMQHQIATAATEIEAARLLVYNAARRAEAGQPFIKEAAMAKYYASEVAARTTGRAVEWMGGVGFTKALLVEKFYRDAKIGQIYEGTSNILLNTVARLVKGEMES